MPSFCNVLFFSTSKKLRREFLTNTDEETEKEIFLFFVRDLNFTPLFSSLSLNNNKSKKSLDRNLWFGMTKI